MRIFAFHDHSGCGEYRVKIPLGELARHGHDVQLRLGGTGEEARSWPIVVGQRIDKHDALPVWRRLKAGSRLVFEIDDDVFNVEPVNWMAHRVYSQPLPRDTVAHAAEVADLVTVTTEPLAEIMRRYNPNVAILPNYVPDEILSIDRPRGDKTVIGWAGGASHGLDLQMVAPVLRRVLDRNPHAEMHLIGTDYEETIGRECRFSPWDSDLIGYYRNIDFDVGIAPLTDAVFNRSKSHIKALEYAARGVPVVASDIEPYRGFVVDGVTGWLVRRDHEWHKRINELVNDEAMRVEMGRNAKELARQWTIGTGWELWEQAYSALLG